MGRLVANQLFVGRKVPEGQLLRTFHLLGICYTLRYAIEVFFGYAGIEHVAKVAHQCHIAHTIAADEFGPLLCKGSRAHLRGFIVLLAESRKFGLPGIGGIESAVGNLVEDSLLRLVLRLGVDDEEGITELYLQIVAIILGELVLVKAVESPLQAHLYLVRKAAELLGALALVAPLIAHEEFHDFVGTLHHPVDGAAHKIVAGVRLG